MASNPAHRHKPLCGIKPIDRVDTARLEKLAGATDGEKSDLMDATIAVWQKRSARPLTREDGREIIENMTGFFDLLRKWERDERAGESETGNHPAGTISGATEAVDRGSADLPAHDFTNFG